MRMKFLGKDSPLRVSLGALWCAVPLGYLLSLMVCSSRCPKDHLSPRLLPNVTVHQSLLHILNIQHYLIVLYSSGFTVQSSILVFTLCWWEVVPVKMIWATLGMTWYIYNITEMVK